MLKLILLMIIGTGSLVAWDLYNKIDIMYESMDAMRKYINKECIIRGEFDLEDMDEYEEETNVKN